MKHLLSTVSAAGLLLASVATAQAAAVPALGGWYVGADYNYTTAGYSNDTDDILPDSFPSGGDIYVGFKFHRNLALELGYFATAEERKTITVSGITAASDLSLQGVTVDLVGRYPVMPAFDVIGIVGYGRVGAEVTATAAGASLSDTNYADAIRAGLGAEYKLVDNLAVRGTVKYNWLNFEDVDNLMQYGVGVNYTF